MEGLLSAIRDAFGPDGAPARLTLLQMSLRAALVFVVAVLLVRIGSKRFMGGSTPLDVLLSVVLGAVVSRGINGSAAFGPTLAASAVLVGMHAGTAWLARRWSFLEWLVKGSSQTLVRDGQPQRDAMRRANVTLDDLQEALRLHGVERFEQVRLARLERNGDISVVKGGRRRAGGDAHAQR
jgi:uncharacterized membrane protein YcaP (DUF421 family)